MVELGGVGIKHPATREAGSTPVASRALSVWTGIRFQDCRLAGRHGASTRGQDGAHSIPRSEMREAMQREDRPSKEAE